VRPRRSLACSETARTRHPRGLIPSRTSSTGRQRSSPPALPAICARSSGDLRRSDSSCTPRAGRRGSVRILISFGVSAIRDARRGVQVLGMTRRPEHRVARGWLAAPRTSASAILAEQSTPRTTLPSTT
jgi:hypothetical protein